MEFLKDAAVAEVVDAVLPPFAKLLHILKDITSIRAQEWTIFEQC
jgi:hypothetical protein